MAGTALKECNALLSFFVENLTERELSIATETRPCVAYANIAQSMWSRGFLKAGKVASALTITSMRDGSLSDSLQSIKILLGGMLKYLTIRPIRSIVPMRLKRRIQALLQRKK